MWAVPTSPPHGDGCSAVEASREACVVFGACSSCDRRWWRSQWCCRRGCIDCGDEVGGSDVAVILPVGLSFLWKKAARHSGRAAAAQHPWQTWRRLWRVQEVWMGRGVPLEWHVTSSPCTVRRPWVRRSCDGVSSLDSGAGENVVKWCLVCRRVGQKSPAVVQHAQEMVELTGGLGSLQVL
jgi:hypothetical protein